MKKGLLIMKKGFKYPKGHEGAIRIFIQFANLQKIAGE